MKAQGFTESGRKRIKRETLASDIIYTFMKVVLTILFFILQYKIEIN